MALNWYLNKIKGYKDLCWTPKDENGYTNLNPVTDALIWNCLHLDLNGITDKNLDEWAFRLAFAHKIGAGITLEPIPMDQVKAHVGLSTNVGTKTRKQWMARIIKNIEMDINYEIANKKKEVAA